MFVFYALYVDYQENKPKPLTEDVSPQASEYTEEVGQQDTISQNVKFIDTHPGYRMTAHGEMDAVRNAPFTQDATLDEFFSRPLRIYTREWSVNTTLYETFNPWTLYFQNLRVINRISNYKLLQAKLCIKVTINGNAFHYGRALLSYNPLPTRDNMTIDRAFVDADNVAATQRPHIYLDPTNSQGGELCLPFFYYKNAMDIPGEDWTEMGECTLNSLTQLKHANGATDTVSVNIFAWATDVKFAIPTQLEPGQIAPQAMEIFPHADEYGSGPISKPASIIANIASKMSMIPTIGPFARATELGAGALASMATLFGYSRPVDLSKSMYRPQPKNDMSIIDISDDVTKLSVTAKQELTLDPRTTGLSGVDELGINYIASRESYLVDFPWQIGAVKESLLWNCVVDPCLVRYQGNEIHMPACAFAAYPFAYWRGSMEFRFQVVCSKFHKGRLKVVYDPSGNTSGNAEYNTAYTTIVDLSDTTDFTVKCGWGQSTSYRNRINESAPETSMYRQSLPLAYSSPSIPFGNGTIAVYVVNSLTVPDTTIDNDIEINVFVKMGDDFEVAQMEDNNINFLKFTNSSIQVQPQADEQIAMENDGDEADRMDSAPLGSKVVDQAANTISLTDYTNHVHFGESIRSFRQLIKRYMLHEHIPFTCDPAFIGQDKRLITEYVRDMLPFEPGYSATGNSVTYSTLNGPYYFSNMTLLRYLTSAYGGWRGGVRWMYDASGLNRVNSVGTGATIISSRDGIFGNQQNASFEAPDPTTIAGQELILTSLQRQNGWQGSILNATAVNPVSSVEVPYYSEYRFTPGKQRVGTNFNMPKIRTTCMGRRANESLVTTWCAAAEDFNCFFYLGPPIFYLEEFPAA